MASSYPTCPSTPEPSSSQSSSAFPRTPSTPIGSARRIVGGGYSTPPSSPPPPVTPSSSRTPARKTLHLVSPRKTTPSTTRLLAPLPSSSPSRTPHARPRPAFTVKGNVTPSRASAFFAPRSRVKVARGIDSSPSSSHYASLSSYSPGSLGNTSARRGVKRRHRDHSSSSTLSSSPSKGKQRCDRISFGLQDGSLATTSNSRQLAGRPLFMMSDDDDDSDKDSDFDDGTMFDTGSFGHLSSSRSVRAPSPSLLSHRPSFAKPAAALASLSGSASPSPRKPVPMAMRSHQAGGVDLASALAKMRCGGGVGLASTALRRQVAQTSYHSTFASHPSTSVYRVASHEPDAAPTQPLCASYSWSAKSYGATRQWLAVGDNEGKLTLVDTARDPSLDSFDPNAWYSGEEASSSQVLERPSWEASPVSLFSLSWRYDDRFLATSGSDYQVKVFDTSTAQQVHAFAGSKGSARCIEWDPSSRGQLLASAGRDGGVHVFDLRMPDGKPCQSTAVQDYDHNDEDDGPVELLPPLLSLWSAHTAVGPSQGVRSRGSKTRLAPRGVTSLVYHPHREHCIFTAGCADASIRGWDLRFAIKQRAGGGDDRSASNVVEREPLQDVSNRIDDPTDSTPTRAGTKRKSRKPRKLRPGEASFVLNSGCCPDDDDEENTMRDHLGEESDPVPIAPCGQTDDLSMTIGKQWNTRSHGISSMCVAGGHQQRMYAACTDGRIYMTPLSSLEPGVAFNPSQYDAPLFHPTQLGNSLYSRLSLCPDERTLAIGCNNGSILLWDTDVRRASILGGSVSLQADSECATPSRRRHMVNCEINALDWCYDPSSAGWRLATASDDCTVRVWEADRGLAVGRGG